MSILNFNPNPSPEKSQFAFGRDAATGAGENLGARLDFRALTSGHETAATEAVQASESVAKPETFEDKQRAAMQEIGNISVMSPEEAIKQLGTLQHKYPELFGHMTMEDLRKMKVADEMSTRDKFGFLGAAMFSPLFLLGMGAAFSVMDEMKQAKEGQFNKHMDAKTSALAAARADAAINNALKEKEKKKLESLGPIKPFKSSEAADTSYLKYGLKKQANGSDKGRVGDKVRAKIFQGMEKSWDERAAQRSLKNWIKNDKMDKLVKHKAALTDHMEKVRGKVDYASFARLAAQAEIVDKQLKRQGL